MWQLSWYLSFSISVWAFLFVLYFLLRDFSRINPETESDQIRNWIGNRHVAHTTYNVSTTYAFSDFYRPQTKFAKVMFLQVSVCPQGRGACVAGEHVWQGACMVGVGVCMVGRGVHGRGVCMVRGIHGGGHVWQGGMHGRRCAWQGVCMAGGHVWWQVCVPCMPPRQILWLRHTVNERAVHILLECILVNNKIRSYVPRDLNYPYELKEYCPIKRSV